MISLFSKHKPQTVVALESKLSEARAAADAEYVAIGEATLALEENGPNGAKRLAEAQAAFDAATKRACELEAALLAAQTRQAAQSKEAEALARADYEKRLRAIWGRIEACGPGVNAAVANLVESLKPLIDAQREAAAMGASQRMQDAVRDSAAWLQPVIAYNLRGMPGFSYPPIDAALLSLWSERVPQWQDGFLRRD